MSRLEKLLACVYEPVTMNFPFLVVIFEKDEKSILTFKTKQEAEKFIEDMNAGYGDKDGLEYF